MWVDALVHISAPTTKQDDDRFRAQAKAYTAFEASGSHHVVLKAAYKPSKDTQASAATPSATSAAPCVSQPSTSSTKEVVPRTLANPGLSKNRTQEMFNTQHAAAGIESQISEQSSDPISPGYLQNITQTWKRRRLADDTSKPCRPQARHLDKHARRAQSQLSLPNGNSLVSETAQNKQRAEASSPKRTTEHTATNVHKSGDRSRTLSLSARMEQEIQEWRVKLQVQSGSGQHGQAYEREQEQQAISSLLPETYDLSRSDSISKSVTSRRVGDVRVGVSQEQRNSRQSTIIDHNITQHYHDVEQRTSARNAVQVVSPQGPDDLAYGGTADRYRASIPDIDMTKMGARNESAQGLAHAQHQDEHMNKPSESTQRYWRDANVMDDLRQIPRHIFPIEGLLKDRIVDPADLEYRAALVERHMLYRRQSHRELHMVERGYWDFYISAWAAESKLDFLRDLRHHVEHGSLGPGIWVDIQHDGNKCPQTCHLYCSGAEIGDSWLLLMTLSEKKLGEWDMHWIGWDGQPAVTMPGKNKRGRPAADS